MSVKKFPNSKRKKNLLYVIPYILRLNLSMVEPHDWIANNALIEKLEAEKCVCVSFT